MITKAQQNGVKILYLYLRHCYECMSELVESEWLQKTLSRIAVAALMLKSACQSNLPRGAFLKLLRTRR